MMNAALTDTTTDLTPAPDTLFGNTGVSYNAAQLITIACHAVSNTVFIAPTPKPAWFDELNADLAAAQTLAETWINSLGTQVTKTIPLQVINFGTNFTAANNAIQQIVAANPAAQGADNTAVVEIKTIIQQALISPIGTVINEMGLVSTQLTTWGKAMQDAHNKMVNGSTNIQAAETLLTTDIAKMNNAISTLHVEIAAENKAIAESAAAIAVGVFALVVGVALAPETGGASLLIGGAIGAAGIIGGAVTWGIMQSRINSQFDDIGHDQQELAGDQRQLVALQGLQMASNSAVSSIELATQSLSKLQTQWGTFQGELQGVLSKLESAETQLSTIMEGVFTSAAQTEWATAIATANNLVNSPVQIQSQTLPIPS
ncbi:alpha-pore-forming cytotoxin MakA [Pseudomonas viridiflava]|uniref:alpha-pore-forming cytotoxin MakA n=2 Tax=Pseudomonas viridiflava TaxID=33069 RepID=UPI0013CEE1CA|nr:non-hemolytic enterotoxin lytic component L1 [Pseudomonas viridiflava]